MIIEKCSWCNKLFKTEAKVENRCTCGGIFCSLDCEREHSGGATIAEIKELEK